ncbi:MAG: site-specific integrase [Prevotella sp.]|nr:site-specific integrase [Prevotella sp.]
MATIKIYLDMRGVSKGNAAPLKIAITKHSSTSYIGLDVKVQPSQWDAKSEKVKDAKNKAQINNYIHNRKSEVENLLMRLTADGELTGFTCTQIKNKLLSILSPKPDKTNNFVSRFEHYISQKMNASTIEKYSITLKRIMEYDRNARTLTFEDIGKDWLTDFDKFLIKYNPAKNSRNIHFRNIRAVFNDAIDNEITTAYPFRKFKIQPEPTAKRSLTIEQLRELWNYPVEPFQQRYLDMFKLTFYLIGINTIDLCRLTAIENGRVVYRRAKTGRLYNIKVEPEALEIIDRYRGTNFLLNLSESFNHYHTFTGKLDKGLKSIGPAALTPNPDWTPKSKKHRYHIERTSAFPGLSIYWARHTWATIASELDIPDATISSALGHGHGNPTTAIYIDFNARKIDEANRKVIDYVLYDKR